MAGIGTVTGFRPCDGQFGVRRQVQLISASSRKDDRMDAQVLARLARVDPQLLRPIRHRGEKAPLAAQHLLMSRPVLCE